MKIKISIYYIILYYMLRNYHTFLYKSYKQIQNFIDFLIFYNTFFNIAIAEYNMSICIIYNKIEMNR
jgi:hypothetical protein